jgi:hypothetical protein
VHRVNAQASWVEKYEQLIAFERLVGKYVCVQVSVTSGGAALRGQWDQRGCGELTELAS